MNFAFAGGENLRVIDNHWKRITHVHTKDIRRAVVDGLDRTKESFLDAVVKGAFTVPGDGSLDFEAIVKACAKYGYEGWFVVEAEQGRARVLGTQFEVRLQPQGAQVTVLSGRVGVTAQAGAEQQVLGAGQQVAYHAGRAEPLHAVDSEAQLAWRQGWLNYARAPLADVIADLQRYYPGRIILLNDELAARRISGSFPSKDPRAVLASLQGVLGFEQHELGSLIFVR